MEKWIWRKYMNQYRYETDNGLTGVWYSNLKTLRGVWRQLEKHVQLCWAGDCLKSLEKVEK